jgi:hypothetical protein
VRVLSDSCSRTDVLGRVVVRCMSLSCVLMGCNLRICCN